jgi:hypothetical protein
VPGTLVTLLIGPSVPAPAPPPLSDALDRIEVTHSDEGRSGFQLSFSTGLGGPESPIDYPLLGLPQLRPFSRVIVVVTVIVVPTVLMDGVITHTQLQPGDESGSPSTITVTGEDVSLMMDLEEKSAEHPAQPEALIALELIGSYAQYGLIPVVIPPPAIDAPLPMERVPAQQSTDLAYLNEMAQRFGYVFYVAPGPVPLTNTAYWGPPKRTDLPQHALSVDLGPDTNVESLHFTNNALAPTIVKGKVQDRETGEDTEVTAMSSLRPPLSLEPAVLANQPNVRTRQFRASGLTAVQAFARAQGLLEGSPDAVTAEGEVDTLRYGHVLQSRALVDVRGAGFTHNGSYYVKRVTHRLSAGSYRQSFTLTREGTGALTPMVVP